MMKIAIVIFFLSTLTVNGFCSEDERTVKAPEEQQQFKDIHLADPTIFFHDGTYHLYGTSQGDLSERGKGFLVFTSTDLENWRGPMGANDGFALKEGDAFGSEGFWAPQVFIYKDQFYMAYTANENIAVATSNNPLGPFTNSSNAPLEAPVKQIDPYVFFDDDGKIYLYHVRLEQGNRIFVAEINEDLMSIKPGTLKFILAAEEQWEDAQEVPWPASEGPTVLKRDGFYYMVYSANDFRNPDYAVGYAVSESPYGPWKKPGQNPLIEKETVGENGPGHGDVFIDKNGQMHYVFHMHFSLSEVHPRKGAVLEINFVEQEGETAQIQVEEGSFNILERKINK